MQRKFLEDLGLEKDIIDKIMTENGNDIEKTKSKLEAERDNYKEQLETAQNALKEFEGVDVKDLQGKIDTLNNTLQTKETEYQNKIADMEFNAVLDGELSKVGAKNAKAVKALLDLDSLKTSKNQAEDIKTALETLKNDESTAFMFDVWGEGKPTFKGMHPGNPGGNPPSGTETNYETRLAEARKNGNTAAAVAIKREAAANGINLI